MKNTGFAHLWLMIIIVWLIGLRFGLHLNRKVLGSGQAGIKCSGLVKALGWMRVNSRAGGNPCRLTLTAVFVLWEDIAVLAGAHIRPRSVLTGAVGLAQKSVCSTFVKVWKGNHTGGFKQRKRTFLIYKYWPKLCHCMHTMDFVSLFNNLVFQVL